MTAGINSLNYHQQRHRCTRL